MSERRSWRVLAIGGLLGLVGIVAVAAAGRGPGVGEARPSADPPTLVADYIGTISLLVIPAGAVLIVWMTFMRKSIEAQTGVKRRSGYVVFAIIAIVLAAFLFAATHFGWSPKGQSVNPRRNPIGGIMKKPPEATNPYNPHFQWLPVLVLGSLLVGVAGSTVVLLLRRKRHGLPPVTVAVALSQALGETLDDLRAEPDPRKAVIGAYARMERALAARGVPREAFEAPLEYLARILDVVHASAHSVRRLTQLFERARFSPHEIDAGMKDDAIDALSGLRAELEAAG
jgi:membrane protease YdiL (CAAX protease family)